MHARSLVYLAARARVAVALAPQSGHNSAHDTLARGILRSLEPLGARGHNDFASDGHGGVYLSASGVYDIKAPITGAVLHMSADGKTLTEVADTIHYSNGLTLDKGQRHLLVAEMLAGRVLSFPNRRGRGQEARAHHRGRDAVRHQHRLRTCDDMRRSLISHRRERNVGNPPTICDAMQAYTPGAVPFEAAAHLVSRGITVDDDT